MPPLALLAIAFAVGIAAGEALHPPRAVALLVAAASLVLLVMLRRRARPVGVAALLAAALLGALALVAARPVAPAGLLDGEAWDVTARVVTAPERSGPRSHLLVDVESVARAGVARAAPCRVSLALPGDADPPLVPGDRVRFHARLLAPRGFAEPGAPDPTLRQAARGVAAVAGLPDPAALVRLAGEERGGAMRAVGQLRAALLARVHARLPSEERGGLVASLVLGDRGGVGRPLEEAFQRAGVAHVLSVSGLHLALATLLAFVGLRRLLLFVEPLARRVAPRRVAAAVALPLAALYTLLTGAAVATVRSFVAAAVWLGGAALSRPASSSAALGAAALAILVASPLALWDVSFQLSFAAAIGGVGLASPLFRLVTRRLPRRWWARPLRATAAVLCASAAAIAATAPLSAWHFGQLAPAGLLANPIVVPLAEGWVLPTGLLACAAAPLRAISDRLLDLAGAGAWVTAWFVRWVASWAPAGHVPPPTVVEAALWWGALAALARRRFRVAAALLALFGVAIATRGLAARLRPELVASFLDVGQGDAALIELPDGTALLVDGGGSFDPAFDPGADLIVPWLERHGVRRLAAVVLTHPHPDHANGLAAVVERFPTDEVWTNGAPSRLPGLVRLERAAAASGTPVLRPHALARGGATVEVLHPLDGGAVRVAPGSSENDGSIVLRVAWAGRAILLSGDIEARAEERLVAAGAPLAADVLKVPHHGSRTSSTAPFLAAVHPSIAVFSVGASNRWHFPAPSVVARLRAAGAALYRTDTQGAITVRVARSGAIAVVPARAGPLADGLLTE